MEIINKKYKIINKIGEGSFGSIYKGENIRTRENVAIKVESIKSETKLLKNESIIYHYLNNTNGIPSVKWFGKDNNNYYMVINLLGNSLQEIINIHFSFSLKLVLQIGIMIIKLIKTTKNVTNFLDEEVFDITVFIVEFGCLRCQREHGARRAGGGCGRRRHPDGVGCPAETTQDSAAGHRCARKSPALWAKVQRVAVLAGLSKAGAGAQLQKRPLRSHGGAGVCGQHRRVPRASEAGHGLALQSLSTRTVAGRPRLVCPCRIAGTRARGGPVGRSFAGRAVGLQAAKVSCA